MDQNGCCRIVGRTKEIIIRGGINIYPREIEEVLITHPLVKNAAVCGVPDPRLGEEVCAWITLRDPSATVKVDALREFCKGKLAYFKIPRKILIVDEFPMTKSGKVQKFKMSEMSIKLLMDRNKSEI
ncbi:AMP-binding protein-like protein [Dinothrombium tinctorium]|uniref:AMP-binding protein-like protein n=1 Tax=Dinothrombium tinctorium TaxID=1965070 RepID=A0A3S3PAE0_9ACAR|nr:AMP-binding protein-like protein [Dinothrombium tinctorium]